MPKTKNLKTESDVFEAFRAEHELNDTDFAYALAISKGRWSNWKAMRHYAPREWLIQTARVFSGAWQSELAADLLRRRGFEDDIPCVCLELIGDNGPCPKHVQVEKAVA